LLGARWWMVVAVEALVGAILEVPASLALRCPESSKIDRGSSRDGLDQGGGQVVRTRRFDVRAARGNRLGR